MASLDSLNDTLGKAAKLLDQAAEDINAVGLESEQNVRKIAKALVEIFEIQQQIYKQRPDLMPPFLKGGRRD